MGSFGLNIGLRALMTAQSNLETVGHNISNANTEGYSRQDLQVSAARPLRIRGLEIGGGVTGDRVLRTEDTLLTRRIVGQTSVVERLDSMVTNMSGVEALLGEPNGFGLGKLLDGFFSSVSDLSTNPDDLVFRTGVTQAATSLTSQFDQLANELSKLKSEAGGRVDFFTNEVNVRAEEIVELNKEITQVEATGVSANDLRDQRDLALRKLAKQIDVTFYENGQGSVRVLVGGQLLVGPTTVNKLTAQTDPQGKVQLFVGGGTEPVKPRAGGIGGLISFAEEFVPGLAGEIDKLARAMIVESNRIHSTGIPQSGGFQNLAGSFAVQDTDGDGENLDELLSSAGLPFGIQSGVLYVNLKELSTDELVTTRIDIDPERTTISDLLDGLNSIDAMSASLDSFGRIQIASDSGFRFDFSRRMNESPDVFDTLGGGRASIGASLQGPFNLIAGSTLDLTGPVSSFSVTFSTGSFNDMSEASAGEVVDAINSTPDMATNLLRAVAVGDQVFLQTIGTGSTESLTIDGGTASGTLGFAAATTVTGSNTAVDVGISGEYTGDQNELYVFRPSGDGQIGTTPGLQIIVETEAGQPIATLDVGPAYLPGTPIPIADGLSASFTFGEISATDNDTLQVNAIADSDTSDVLVALGVNSLFDGTDADTFELRQDIASDPSLLAASASGAEGDNGILLDLMALSSDDVQTLDSSFGEFYGGVVGGVGFDISSTQNSFEVEDFLIKALDNRRAQVSGVNVDEELVDMIQFEQAFSAAAQFIQVINQLQDEILRLV
jgi:flagellar hook-associated protein 1